MRAPGPLLRPSQLARFWELHPKTVVQWIHDGKLPAIRTPGGQWRVRPSDLAEHCARTALPVPPFATRSTPRVHLVGAPAATVRAVRRALGDVAEVEAYVEPLAGLMATVRAPPAIVALDASARGIDVADAVRALAGTLGTPERASRSDTRIIVFHAASAKRADALLRAGAVRALVKHREPALASIVAELLA
jgi:excisionase family DNA binding protein